MERTIHLGDGARLKIKRHAHGAWCLHHSTPGGDVRVCLDNDDQAREKITWLLAGAMTPRIHLT